MKSITSKWFECKIQYDKVDDSGITKKVTESYVVDALSFTEAESSITEEMTPFISGEFEIKGIKPASFKEVFFSDDAQADKWYKVTLKFITIDEKTEKEKTQTVTYIVQASSFEKAVKSISEIMSGSMQEYKTATVTETQFMDVFEHKTA